MQLHDGVVWVLNEISIRCSVKLFLYCQGLFKKLWVEGKGERRMGRKRGREQTINVKVLEEGNHDSKRSYICGHTDHDTSYMVVFPAHFPLLLYRLCYKKYYLYLQSFLTHSQENVFLISTGFQSHWHAPLLLIKFIPKLKYLVW